jgi:hypothetical protein
VRSPRWFALAALIGFGIASATSPVAAEPQSAPSPEAKQRFERGIDLFRQGDYGGALGEFRRAYELSPYSVVLYNLGLTYAALGRPVEAADAMKGVLDEPGSLSGERLAKAREVMDEQSARIASLSISANVDGARIEVDGVERGTTPLAKPIRVKSGPHRITLIKSGYAPSRHEIDAPSGKVTSLEAELEPTEVRLGHLEVHTKLPGATVLVDGEPVGVTPLPGEVTLLPGSHRVELTRSGYRSAATTLTIGAGAKADVTLEPEPDQAAIDALGAELELQVSEDQAILTVDGAARPAGKRIAMAPGPHVLRVERDGFYPVERTVDLAEGRTETLVVTLEPTAETLAAHVSEARTFQVLGWIGVLGGAAVAGGAVSFLVVNQGAKDDARAEIEARNREFEPGGRCDDASLVTDQEYCGEQTAAAQQDDFDSAKARDIIGFIGLGVGAAAVTTGVVLLLVGDDPDKYDRDVDEELVSRAVPMVRLGPHGGFVGMSGAF